MHLYPPMLAAETLTNVRQHDRGLLFNGFSFFIIFILYMRDECKVVKQLDKLSVAIGLSSVR